MKNKISLILATLVILLGSCASQKKVPYMIDAETIPQEALDKIAANNEPRVMPGDLLEITVMSYNIDAVRPFNRSSFVTELNRTTSNYSNDTNRNTYYIVDDNGDIEFPVIGKLRIGGMNKSQIQELICNEIYPKYITEKPGVDVRFKNFKVSVIGEVRSPGVYTATNEHLNILEAIALAGDLNITGMRENIMLIRTDADGNIFIDFTAPDFCTTWLLQAVAYTANLHTARIVREVMTTKPLMVRANMPRFVRQGDKVQIASSVINASDSSQQCTARVELFNIADNTVLASRQINLALAARETQPVTIDWIVPDTLACVGYRVKAATSQFGDGEQHALVILPSISPVVETLPFFIDAGAKHFDLQLPKFSKGSRVTL